MRIQIVVAFYVAAALIAAPAISAEKAAVGATTATEAAKPGALATRKLPGKTKGVVGPTAGVMELTADECTALGGTVHDSTALCKSGKYCGREDESGTRHRTCLEVAAQ
jgi:hypothetical protein